MAQYVEPLNQECGLRGRPMILASPNSATARSFLGRAPFFHCPPKSEAPECFSVRGGRVVPPGPADSSAQTRSSPPGVTPGKGYDRD